MKNFIYKNKILLATFGFLAIFAGAAAGSENLPFVGGGANTVTPLNHGGSGTPGGADTNVQYNDGGALGGDSNFTWNKTNFNLAVGDVGLTSQGHIFSIDNLTTQTTKIQGFYNSIEDDLFTVSTDRGELLIEAGDLEGANHSTKWSINDTMQSFDILANNGVSISNLTASQPVFTNASKYLVSVATIPVANGGTGTATAFTTGSVVFAGGSGVYAQDNTNFFWDDSNNQFSIGADTVLQGSSINPFTIGGSVNSYFASYVQNKSNGTSASSDITAGNDIDDGTFATGHYVDMGINSSTYSDPSLTAFAANSGYYFINGGDLNIGTFTAAKKINFITGGGLSANVRGAWTDTGLGVGTASTTSKLEAQTNALGTSQTASSGLALTNTTAAAAGAQQISPAIRWTGQGWKTNATAASQVVEFRSYILPIQGAASPSATWTLQSAINAGAFSDQLTVGSNGNVTSTADLNAGGMAIATSGIQSAQTATNSNLWVTGGSNANSTNTATYLFAGAANVAFRVGIRGSTATTLSANNSYGAFVIGNSGITEAGSGTHALLAAQVIRSFAITNGSAATTNTASLYIEDAPTGITPTGANMALWIDAGPSRLDGTLSIGTANVATSILDVGGAYAASIRTITTGTTLDNTYSTVLCDATAGAVTVTLPSAASAFNSAGTNTPGWIYNIKKIDSSINACTITRAGSDTIDGATTSALSVQYSSKTIQSAGGTAWYIL